jgi:hypothetical protein
MKAPRIGIAAAVLTTVSLLTLALLPAGPASAAPTEPTDDGAIYDVAGQLGGPAIRVLGVAALIGLLYVFSQRRAGRKANRLADQRLRERIDHRPLMGRPTVAPAYATFVLQEEGRPVRYVPLADAATARVASRAGAEPPSFLAQRPEQYSFVPPAQQPVLQPKSQQPRPQVQPQRFVQQLPHFQPQPQFQPQQFAPRPMAPQPSQTVVPHRLVPQAPGARPDAASPTTWVPQANPEPPRYIAPGSPGR